MSGIFHFYITRRSYTQVTWYKRLQPIPVPSTPGTPSTSCIPPGTVGTTSTPDTPLIPSIPGGPTSLGILSATGPYYGGDHLKSVFPHDF